jgi:integrase
MKRPRYQLGTLYSEPRKNGSDVWVYRWRETDGQGKRTLRKQIVGTVRELRTQADAQRAAEALRMNINRHTVEHGGPPQTVNKLVEHYRLKEMPMDTHEGRTRGTKLVYNSNLRLYVVPRWGEYPLRRVTTVEVEEWLKTLKLAPSSRAKIRNLMSTVFRHAIRWGWIGQHENPITLVRVCAKRKRVPETLTAEEFRALFAALPDRERAIGTICATTGLRVCEVLGLKWEDIDCIEKTANVLRSFVDGAIGPCKTEISQQPIPLDEIALRNCLHGESSALMGQMSIGSLAARGPSESCRYGPTVFATRSCSPLRKKSVSGSASDGIRSGTLIARCWRRPEMM